MKVNNWTKNKIYCALNVIVFFYVSPQLKNGWLKQIENVFKSNSVEIKIEDELININLEDMMTLIDEIKNGNFQIDFMLVNDENEINVDLDLFSNYIEDRVNASESSDVKMTEWFSSNNSTFFIDLKIKKEISKMVLSISESKERKLDEVKKIFKSPLTERDGGKKTANKRVRGSGDKFKEYIEKIINDPDIDNLITVHAPFAHGEYILTAEKIFSLDKWVDNPPKDEYNFDFKIDDLYASLEAFASDDVECKDDSFENNERFFSLKNRYNISDNISTNLIGDLGELISIVFLEEEHNFVDVSLSTEGDSFDIVAYKNDEIYYFEVKTKLKESNTSTATITEGEKEHLNKNKNTFVILVEVESSFVKMFEETLKNMYGEVSNINSTDMINALETLKSSNQFLVIKYEVNMYDWKDIRDDESRIKTKCIAEIKF